MTDADIEDPTDDGSRPVEGGIYSIAAQDGFRLCKVVYLGKHHCCILLFAPLFKARPKRVNLKKPPQLIPAHHSGWMIGAYKNSTFKTWEPELIVAGKVTKGDQDYLDGWKAFGGVSLTPPR